MHITMEALMGNKLDWGTIRHCIRRLGCKWRDRTGLSSAPSLWGKVLSQQAGGNVVCFYPISTSSMHRRLHLGLFVYTTQGKAYAGSPDTDTCMLHIPQLTDLYCRSRRVRAAPPQRGVLPPMCWAAPGEILPPWEASSLGSIIASQGKWYNPWLESFKTRL